MDVKQMDLLINNSYNHIILNSCSLASNIAYDSHLAKVGRWFRGWTRVFPFPKLKTPKGKWEIWIKQCGGSNSQLNLTEIAATTTFASR